MKKLLTERLQELAGIKPLYTLNEATEYDMVKSFLSNKGLEVIDVDTANEVYSMSLEDFEGKAYRWKKEGYTHEGKPIFNIMVGYDMNDDSLEKEIQSKFSVLQLTTGGKGKFKDFTIEDK